jgi:hypothetical protein
MKGFLLTALLALLASPLCADIDESAYEAVGAVRSERERQRLQKQFAVEAEAEHRRIAEEDAALARAITAAEAAEAARPYPERLTRQQCTLCHPAGHYASKHHTWLYWRLIVSRMVWLNEAPIPADAQATIVNHLAATHPARGEEIMLEYILPALTLALFAGAARAGHQFWKGRG